MTLYPLIDAFESLLSILSLLLHAFSYLSFLTLYFFTLRTLFYLAIDRAHALVTIFVPRLDFSKEIYVGPCVIFVTLGFSLGALFFSMPFL